jgi:hypothetical protein
MPWTPALPDLTPTSSARTATQRSLELLPGGDPGLGLRDF